MTVAPSTNDMVQNWALKRKEKNSDGLQVKWKGKTLRN